MSNIEYSPINEQFPVQGIDNPSQGFRSNFGFIKTALQHTKTELEAVQSIVQSTISPDGEWIGEAVGIQGPAGQNGAQGTAGVLGTVGTQGPAGIDYNTTIIVNLGEFTLSDSEILITPVASGSRIYLANLGGVNMNGTIRIDSVVGGSYGECVLLLTSDADGTNVMTVSNTNAKWVNGYNRPLMPLEEETVGLYVQSIAGTVYLSVITWF